MSKKSNIFPDSIREVVSLLTPGDKILMATILILSLFSFYTVARVKETGHYVAIEVAGKLQHRLELRQDREVEVSGPVGKTYIQIRAGKVRVTHSDCPHKLCMRARAIGLVGEIIICVPNKVVVRIEGKSKGIFDAITG